MEISGNYFSGNNSNYGGGAVFGFYGAVLMEDNTVINNWSLFSGGGIFFKFGTGQSIRSCIIAGNESQYGGGIYMENYPGLQLVNNTIADNNASEWAGGMYISNFCYPQIINSIIWGNTADTLDNLFVSFSDTVSISYSDIEGGWAGNGNINGNPLFADPVNFDYHLTWLNYPIADTTKSPCIDAGNPSPEYLDPDNTRNDMGAFYFPQEFSAIADLTIHIADSDAVLQWNTVPAAIEYRIYSGDTPTIPTTGLPPAVVLPPDTTYVMTNAMLNTAKFYCVIVIY